MRLSLPLLSLLALIGACVDAQPTSPDFEQRLFSVLGGLSVGDALTLNGEDAESIVLQGGADGARYVFIPFLAAEEGATRLRINVSGVDLLDPGSGTSAPSAPMPAEEESAASHLALRAWEQEMGDALLRGGGAGALRRRMETRLASAQVAAPVVGETVALRVPNRDPGNFDLCANPKQRTGRVTALTEHAILVEDVLNPVALSPADVQRIAEEYETMVHPVSVLNFGEPTDIDGNGRVYIFITAALNETADRQGGGLTVGFTFAADLLPRTNPTSGFACPASNEAEIFYLIAPDPQAVIGVPVSEDLVRRLTTSTIAHELQHMINFGRRLYEVEDVQQFEQVWLNEGLSHIAEELIFFAATGIRPRSNLDWETISASETLYSAYRRFVRDNLASYADYLDSPDTESLMGKRNGDDDFPTRGAAWAFLRYLADQVPTDDAEMFYALVNGRVAGVANLEEVLDLAPHGWMQRWTVASFTDDLPEAPVDVRFTQPSWNFRSIYAGETGGFPLVLRPLAPAGQMSLNLRGGGASFLLLRATAGRQARVNTSRSTQAIFGELRISVVRIQ